MIEIFSGTFTEVINVKNLLENEKIAVFTANEYMSNIQPWTVSSGGLNTVILKVNSEDFDSAKKIIENYKNGNFNLEFEKPNS
jgi:hypothetical protein